MSTNVILKLSHRHIKPFKYAYTSTNKQKHMLNCKGQTLWRGNGCENLKLSIALHVNVLLHPDACLWDTLTEIPLFLYLSFNKRCSLIHCCWYLGLLTWHAINTDLLKQSFDNTVDYVACLSSEMYKRMINRSTLLQDSVDTNRFGKKKKCKYFQALYIYIYLNSLYQLVVLSPLIPFVPS